MRGDFSSAVSKLDRGVSGIPASAFGLWHSIRFMTLRIGWGFLDQAASSLTNFVFGVFVARTVGPAEFGAFSLALVSYWLALNVSRAISSQPLIIRYGGASKPEWKGVAAASTGTSGLVGVLAGAVCVVVSALTSGSFHEAFLALGISLPGLMVQDAWRYAFFAAGRGRSATVNDLIWAVALIPAIALCFLTGSASVFTLTLAWGAAAAIAAISGVVQSGALPSVREAPAWWRRHRDISARFLAEAGTGMGAGYLSTYLISAIAGLAAVGALRAGEMLIGPLNVVFQGAHLTALPHAVRQLSVSRQRVRETCVLLSIGLASITCAWGAIPVLLPRSLGIGLLGSSWDAAHSVVLAVTISFAGLSVAAGAQIGLRALAAAKTSLRVRVVASTVQLALAVVGASLGGAVAAAWFLAAASWLNAVLWWVSFQSELRQSLPGDGTGPIVVDVTSPAAS